MNDRRSCSDKQRICDDDVKKEIAYKRGPGIELTLKTQVTKIKLKIRELIPKNTHKFPADYAHIQI